MVLFLPADPLCPAAVRPVGGDGSYGTPANFHRLMRKGLGISCGPHPSYIGPSSVVIVMEFRIETIPREKKILRLAAKPALPSKAGVGDDSCFSGLALGRRVFST